ncbi:MAG: hypothetical protein IJT91_05005, partial [Clostridia bacterium]|nr:hypothetical protein [Clostridia bacterium]
MAKKYLELFTKYIPGTEDAKYLSEAVISKTLVDREAFRVNAFVSFPEYVPRQVLLRIEEDTKNAHGINEVKIHPRFPESAFSTSVISDVFDECLSRKCISKGYFDDGYSCEYEYGTLTIYINFRTSGIDLLNEANTPFVISDVIREWFGIDVTVNIVQDEGFSDEENEYGSFVESEMENFYEMLDRQLADDYAELRRENEYYEKRPAKEPDENALPKQTGIDADAGDPVRVSDGIIRIGRLDFDHSAPELIYGEDFSDIIDDPTPIGQLSGAKASVVVFGRVVMMTDKETKKGDKVRLTVGITDNTHSIDLKMVLTKDEAKAIMSPIKQAKYTSKRGKLKVDYFNIALAVQGAAKFDKYENCMVIEPKDIMRIGTVERMD